MLFAPVPVAIAFVVGAFVILWAERRQRARPDSVRIDDVDAMRWTDALKVGFAQAFALIPGTSRSGATIIGGMLFGLSRKAATEFSFFLAIPTLFAAGGVLAVEEPRRCSSAADLPAFGVGFAASFVSAFLCVRWLIRYVSHHDFVPFAWYRIAFGAVILVTAYRASCAGAEVPAAGSISTGRRRPRSGLDRRVGHEAVREGDGLHRVRREAVGADLARERLDRRPADDDLARARRPRASSARIISRISIMVVVSSADSPSTSGRSSATASQNCSRGTLMPRSRTSKPTPRSIVTTRFLPMSCSRR